MPISRSSSCPEFPSPTYNEGLEMWCSSRYAAICSSTDDANYGRKPINPLYYNPFGYNVLGSFGYQPKTIYVPDLPPPPPPRRLREKELCLECDTVHSPYPDGPCPSLSCTVCYKQGHDFFCCPYYHDIPEGAPFDSEKNRVICQECGCPFIDTNRWACPYCLCTRAKLKSKGCGICGLIECPVHDDVYAQDDSYFEAMCAERHK